MEENKVEIIFKHNVEEKVYKKLLEIDNFDNLKNIELTKLEEKIFYLKSRSISTIVVNNFYTVPVKTNKNGELIYHSESNLFVAASESVSILKLIAEFLGFKMEMDEISFFEFLYKIQDTIITDDFIQHITYCTSDVSFRSIVKYMKNEYPALLPGEALYLYLFGNVDMFNGLEEYNLEYINSIHHIDSWRSYGILLLVEHILLYNSRYRDKFPIRICLEYLSRHTENAKLEKACCYFLLRMSNTSDMVNDMNTMGIIPTKKIYYRFYLVMSVARYNNVLDRNYGTTIDIRRWNESVENRDYFFNNSIAYDMYNDRELFSTFGIDIMDNNSGREQFQWSPTLPVDFDKIRWRFSYFGCNDMLYKMVDNTGEETIKELELNEDIIIAYGSFMNHRCWTANIIAENFYSPNVQFLVPGYLPESKRDDKYPNDSLSDKQFFSEKQLIDLYLMLNSMNKSMQPERVKELIELLEIYMLNNSNEYVTNLKSELAKIQLPISIFVIWFFYWCILLSLYTRRWKGVGHEYPYSYLKSEQIQGNEEGEELCSVYQSQLWITGQIRRYNALMNMKYATVENSDYWDNFRTYFQDMLGRMEIENIQNESILSSLKKVVSLIENIHVIEIDISNLSPIVTNSPDSLLTSVLNKFVDDNICSPHLSDILRNTSVYHLINLFNYELDYIDDQIYYFIINNLSGYGATKENTPKISLSKFYTTGHIDPDLKLIHKRFAVKLDYKRKMKKYKKESILYLSEHTFYWSNVSVKEEKPLEDD